MVVPQGAPGGGALVPATGKPELFVAPAKLDAEAKAHLAAVARLAPPDKLAQRLAALKAKGAKGSRGRLTDSRAGAGHHSDPGMGVWNCTHQARL